MTGKPVCLCDTLHNTISLVLLDATQRCAVPADCSLSHGAAVVTRRPPVGITSQKRKRCALVSLRILAFQVLTHKFKVSLSLCSQWSSLKAAPVTLSPASTALISGRCEGGGSRPARKAEREHQLAARTAAVELERAEGKRARRR